MRVVRNVSANECERLSRPLSLRKNVVSPGPRDHFVDAGVVLAQEVLEDGARRLVEVALEVFEPYLQDIRSKPVLMNELLRATHWPQLCTPHVVACLVEAPSYRS